MKKKPPHNKDEILQQLNQVFAQRKKQRQIRRPQVRGMLIPDCMNIDFLPYIKRNNES